MNIPPSAVLTELVASSKVSWLRCAYLWYGREGAGHFQERYDQLKSDEYEIQELVHFWVVESVEDLAALPPTPEHLEEHLK
jgi:hypothetical protein